MELHFFKDEFEVKTTLASLLERVTYKQAEALSYALSKWDELEKEAKITREYIHSHNLEWDLLSFYNRKGERK